MADFSAVISCSVGGSSFQIDRYGKTAAGVWDSDGNRTGTRVQYQVTGEVFAASPAALAVALAAIEAQCEEDGADFWIKNGSTVRESIDASLCSEGPRLSMQYVGEQGYTLQEVQITVGALVGTQDGAGSEGEDAGVLSDTYVVRQSSDAEHNVVISRNGEITTISGTSAQTKAFGKIPADDADSQFTYEAEANQDDTRAKYSYTERPIYSPYPTAVGGAKIHDGEHSITTAYDAHNRKSLSYSYQYVGPGAAAWMTARYAALRQIGTVIRARIATATHKSRTASGEFELLAQRSGQEILELVETVSSGGTGPLLEEVRYEGTVPLIYAPAQSAHVYEQSGRAVGLKRYPLPAAYLYDSSALMERPSITRTRTDNFEWQTTWRYRYLFAYAQDLAAPTDPAAAPGFYA